jgi:CDP-glycerol glycerophosphotransferase
VTARSSVAAGEAVRRRSGPSTQHPTAPPEADRYDDPSSGVPRERMFDGSDGRVGDPEPRRSVLRMPSRARIVRAVIGGLLLVVPPRRQVTVYGWPDHEGNAVALVRFLARQGEERRIVWLTSGALPAQPDADGWRDRVRIRSKRSIRGFWDYLRSDVVCFTHGLYRSPEPRRGRVFINLWHGDGPKRTENPEFAARPGATAIVGQTRLWGDKKAVELGMPASSVLVVGNPRIDDFAEPMTPAQRQALTELLGPRFLLWMPTYRDSNGAGFREWSDGRRLSDTGQMAALAAHARAASELHGITLAVKPHPMDRDVYAGVPGLLSIDDDALQALGLTLYQVLGASDALITDYSSVWTDYLVVDRPILLLCPDYEEYAATRGFNVPDLRAVAPGPLVEDAAALTGFIAEVAEGRDSFRARRLALMEEIGAVGEPGASARLWHAVGRLRQTAATRRSRPEGRTG